MTELGSDRRTQTPSARSLSVFVAAYNEAENLEPTIETVRRAFEATIDDYEVIVVDDGSADGTAKIADALAARLPFVKVIHNPCNMGLGYGWVRAIEAASKACFVFVPGDNTWPYPSLRDLFVSLGEAEVITSYPTNPEIRVPARRILSSAYTAILNLMFGLNLRYYHGLTIYPIEFLRSNAITTNGFASMAEALLRAIHAGLSLVAVDCAIEERATGRSKAVSLHSLKSVVGTMFWLFVDLRLRARRGPRSTLGLFGPARSAGASRVMAARAPSRYGDS